MGMTQFITELAKAQGTEVTTVVEPERTKRRPRRRIKFGKKRLKLKVRDITRQKSPEPTRRSVRESPPGLQAWKQVDDMNIVLDLSNAGQESSPVNSPRNSREFMFTSMEIQRNMDIDRLNCLTIKLSEQDNCAFLS